MTIEGLQQDPKLAPWVELNVTKGNPRQVQVKAFYDLVDWDQFLKQALGHGLKIIEQDDYMVTLIEG